MSEVNPVPPPPLTAWTARPFTIPPPPPVVLDPIPAWKWIAALVLFLSFVAGSIALLKWSRKQSHQAGAAIIALHQKMIRGDDAGIFADADATYRETINTATSNGMFDNVRNRLGAPRSSTAIDSNFSRDEAMGSFITVRYITVFDKGRGRETICLHKVDGVWKLAAYNVESPLLRPNKAPGRVTVKASP